MILFCSSLSTWPSCAPPSSVKAVETSRRAWQGRCEACGAWNSMIEEGGAARHRRAGGARCPQGQGVRAGRPCLGRGRRSRGLKTGIAEFDRVTGGGFVAGSVLLLGGEPGIGKSTLLIQACAALARRGERVCYISGEEAMDQVRLRAVRPRPRRRGGGACRRDRSRGHRRDARAGPSSGAGGDRFDPDDVEPMRSRPRPAPSARCAARRRR